MDSHIRNLLTYDKQLSIENLIPNAMWENGSRPSKESRTHYEKKFLYIDNFAKWVFSHPDINFRRIFHTYNPHHLVFENEYSVYRAFKSFEIGLINELKKNNRRVNVDGFII